MRHDSGGAAPVDDGDPSVRSLAQDAISAFVHAPIAVAVCEPDGVVTRVNDAVTRLLGYPAAELVGRDLFRLVDGPLVAAAVEACRSLREGTTSAVVHETRFRTADGRLLDVRVTTSAVRAGTTAHPHAIMHLEDTTDREDLRRRLQHEATHDPLTGLGNRTRFLDELQRALPRGERHGEPVTVLYLDLDDFKTVNDTRGHATGDRVLRAFADHLRGTVRPEDTTARLGGDEFAVLCEGTTARAAGLVVERLTDGSWGRGPGDGDLPRVGVTVGAATSPGPDGRHLDPEELMHAADAVMYAAKARRRG